MKIVVSGGWGYGNLGDDAILDATIGVLSRRYPGCHIVVLTYDLEDSQAHKSSSVELQPCAHALIDQGACEVLRPHITANYSRVQRKLMDWRYKLAESSWWFKRATRRANFQPVLAALEGADLFVMGGGGYFNEKWLCKSRAQLLELAWAQQRNIPIAVLGPTIGKFSGPLADQIAAQLAKARVFTVRDAYSLSDAQRMNPQVKIIPDVAFSTWLPNPPVAGDAPLLGLVFNNQQPALCECLASGVERFLQDRPQWRVRLLVSRLWKYDVAAARNLQRSLRAKGIASEIVLASDFQRLEECMAQCRVVVSENLHGLILAARNLIPVLAINDYPEGSPNYKKFMAFLEQTQAKHLFINAHSAAPEVAAFLAELDQHWAERRRVLADLRNRVRAEYDQVL